MIKYFHPWPITFRYPYPKEITQVCCFIKDNFAFGHPEGAFLGRNFYMCILDWEDNSFNYLKIMFPFLLESDFSDVCPYSKKVAV